MDGLVYFLSKDILRSIEGRTNPMGGFQKFREAPRIFTILASKLESASWRHFMFEAASSTSKWYIRMMPNRLDDVHRIPEVFLQISKVVCERIQ